MFKPSILDYIKAFFKVPKYSEVSESKCNTCQKCYYLDGIPYCAYKEYIGNDTNHKDIGGCRAYRSLNNKVMYDFSVNRVYASNNVKNITIEESCDGISTNKSNS